MCVCFCLSVCVVVQHGEDMTRQAVIVTNGKSRRRRREKKDGKERTRRSEVLRGRREGDKCADRQTDNILRVSIPRPPPLPWA
jgi:hypothetical protein